MLRKMERDKKEEHEVYFNLEFKHYRIFTTKHLKLNSIFRECHPCYLQKVSGELQLLNEQHSKLQTKFDASKTRNKILSSELKGMKEQMKMLVEKGNRDDELISALMVG